MVGHGSLVIFEHLQSVQSFCPVRVGLQFGHHHGAASAGVDPAT
jgi:hypothetical protein